MNRKMFKLAFFVPESHLEIVKSALFSAGAGRIGNYDSVCWQTLGEGQFRPRIGSAPYCGQIDQLKRLPEYKVETTCRGDVLGQALAVLRESHPYEEPVFEYFEINSEIQSDLSNHKGA